MTILGAREIHAFVGKRGTGKSSRAKALCSELMAEQQPIVAFDFHDEYSQLGENRHGEVMLGPLTERVTIAELVDDDDILDHPGLALAVVPSSKESRQAAHDFVALQLLLLKTGDVVFLADELGAWGGNCESELNDLSCQSRHEGMPLIWVCQRAMQIPKTSRSQVTRFNSGLQTDPEDVDVVRRITGSTTLAAQVTRLGPGDSIDWRDDQPREEASPC